MCFVKFYFYATMKLIMTVLIITSPNNGPTWLWESKINIGHFQLLNTPKINKYFFSPPNSTESIIFSGIKCGFIKTRNKTVNLCDILVQIKIFG